MRPLILVVTLLASSSTAVADPGRVADDPGRALAAICARGRERLAAGDEPGARAVLEEAVRALDARADVPSDVAADCLIGLARVVEHDLTRPGPVDEAAALYQRALARRPDPAVRARLSLVGALEAAAGPFATLEAALSHVEQTRCATGAACRVWATASSSWPSAAIREARIVIASNATEGARAYVLVLTAAGAFVMPPIATALWRDGMTGGVGGSIEHRAVLAGGRRQLVVRAAAFRDFAERWDEARPSVQRTVVCDVVDGAPLCTQPFDETGPDGRRSLELAAPGRVTMLRAGARPTQDDARTFEDLRCAPWLFAEGTCPAP